MLSKVLKLILIFSFLIFFFACSFDNKTGIWNNKQKKSTTEDKLKKLSDDQDNFDKEINPELKINFVSKAKKNNEWIKLQFIIPSAFGRNKMMFGRISVQLIMPPAEKIIFKMIFRVQNRKFFFL